MAGPRHLPGSRKTLLGVVALLVVAGVAVGIFFAVGGGSGGRGSASGGSPAPNLVPQFQFRLASVRVMPVGTKKGVQLAARAAAMRIRTTLDTVYATAFLDPRNWQSGHYWNAWRAFTKDAIGRARSDEATLTLGRRAGRAFASVRPHTGRLAVRILLDRNGHPSTAVADVGFAARASERNGHMVVVRSTGHYFLRPRKNGWAIYGYEVKRADAPLVPSPQATQS